MKYIHRELSNLIGQFEGIMVQIYILYLTSDVLEHKWRASLIVR